MIGRTVPCKNYAGRRTLGTWSHIAAFGTPGPIDILSDESLQW
jgi:hypothetical protein